MSYEIIPSCDYETCKYRSNDRTCQVCRDRLAMVWASRDIIREAAIDDLMDMLEVEKE